MSSIPTLEDPLVFSQSHPLSTSDVLSEARMRGSRRREGGSSTYWEVADERHSAADRGWEGPLALTMSLDGFVAGPNHGMGWMTGISFPPSLIDEFVETRPPAPCSEAEAAGTRRPATAAHTAALGMDQSSC